MTIGVFAAMAVMTLAVMMVIPTGQFWLFLGCFLLLFAAAGAGNGSTYRMIPVVFALRGSGDAATGGDVSSKRKAAAALGLISAIGAYGGFLIPQALNLSKLGTGTYTGAFLVFVLAYVALMVLTGPGLRPQRAATDAGSDDDDRHDRRGRHRHALPVLRAPVRDDAHADGQRGRRVRPRVVVSGRDFPTNRGGLCQKGWTSAELLRSPRSPHGAARARGGRPAARDGVGRGARRRRRRACARSAATHGPDAVAVFGGGGLTNEKAYQLGKFARLALGTSRSTTTAGSACPPPPRPATARSASTAGCRSR